MLAADRYPDLGEEKHTAPDFSPRVARRDGVHRLLSLRRMAHNPSHQQPTSGRGPFRGLVFGRRNRAIRTLAIVGLSAMVGSYASPVAIAAAAVTEPVRPTLSLLGGVSRARHPR